MFTTSFQPKFLNFLNWKNIFVQQIAQNSKILLWKQQLTVKIQRFIITSRPKTIHYKQLKLIFIKQPIKTFKLLEIKIQNVNTVGG